MTTVFFVFVIAVIFSLVATPLVGKIGKRFGAVDIPGKRKVHFEPIPRTGGVAIFVSFLLAITAGVSFLETDVARLFVMDRQIITLLIGAVIVGGVGLFDDFHRLDYRIKFIFQGVGASVAFWGGSQITNFIFLDTPIEFGWFSYFVTVLWFLLFINAVNLIDGLDGLAAGVCFFTCCVIVIFSGMSDKLLVSSLFAALAGALLGFLRYNFNPASIFMGDGGSYFLGYAIAGLSIFGFHKSTVTATIMIPVLALGVPVFDTILSPIRRVMVGRNPFKPDNGHIHHMLIEKGLPIRKAVLVTYGITLVFCAFAILVVNVRNEFAGFFLIVLGIIMFLAVRKIGYLEYVSSEKILGWLKDITDTAGFSHERRTFLDLQINVSRAGSMGEMWKYIIQILVALEIDYCALYLNRSSENDKMNQKRDVTAIPCDRPEALTEPDWSWQHERFQESQDSRNLLRIELPLIQGNGQKIGTMLLLRNLKGNGLNHYFFRRVESLRRMLIDTLPRFLT